MEKDNLGQLRRIEQAWSKHARKEQGGVQVSQIFRGHVGVTFAGNLLVSGPESRSWSEHLTLHPSGLNGDRQCYLRGLLEETNLCEDRCERPKIFCIRTRRPT